MYQNLFGFTPKVQNPKTPAGKSKFKTNPATPKNAPKEKIFKRKKSKYSRTQTMSIGERINELVDGRNESAVINDSKLIKAPYSRYLAKGYSQANNQMVKKKTKRKKGASQETYEMPGSKKNKKSFKSVNSRLKKSKNISVWQYKPTKHSKLQLNMSRLLARPGQLPSSLYSRRHLLEESLLSKVQKKMFTCKHNGPSSKASDLGLYNVHPRKAPAGLYQKKAKKKPKSLTQIVVDYPRKAPKMATFRPQLQSTRQLDSRFSGMDLSTELLNRLNAQKMYLKTGTQVTPSSGSGRIGKGRKMFQMKVRTEGAKNKSRHFMKANNSKKQVGKRQRIARLVTDASYFDSLLQNKELTNLSTNFLSKKSNKISRR